MKLIFAGYRIIHRQLYSVWWLQLHNDCRITEHFILLSGVQTFCIWLFFTPGSCQSTLFQVTHQWRWLGLNWPVAADQLFTVRTNSAVRNAGRSRIMLHDVATNTTCSLSVTVMLQPELIGTLCGWLNSFSAAVVMCLYFSHTLAQKQNQSHTHTHRPVT